MDQHNEVLIALRRLIRATDLYSKHLSKTTGLTTPQLLILQNLAERGEATVSELAKAINLSQATVTTILDRLVKKEFILRERSTEDRRKVITRLTEEGKAAIKDTPTALQENFIHKFSELEDWEQTMILSSLQRLATMMDAENLDAAPILDVGTLDRTLGN